MKRQNITLLAFFLFCFIAPENDEIAKMAEGSKSSSRFFVFSNRISEVLNNIE